MTGHEERRKIARELRAAAVYIPNDIDSEDLEMVIATTVCSYDVPNVETLFNRLAELIEPEPERTARLEYDEIHGRNVCTGCGERYEYDKYIAHEYDKYIALTDDYLFIAFKPMRFCPNCGARFKEDDDGNE